MPDNDTYPAGEPASGPLFQRFTERARQVVVLAHDEAKALNHNYIGTEHILLGLIAESEGLGSRVLIGLGLTLDETREVVASLVGRGDTEPAGEIPFTPRTKKVFDLSIREALTLGHNYIGTEHLLLGMVKENEGVATRILQDRNIGMKAVCDTVIALLKGRPVPRLAIPTQYNQLDLCEAPADPYDTTGRVEVLQHVGDGRRVVRLLVRENPAFRTVLDGTFTIDIPAAIAEDIAQALADFKVAQDAR